MVATNPTADCVRKIKDSERKLSDKKSHLETFQTEFCEIKKKYEEACKKLEQDITETHELMTERDQAYNDYISESASKYTNTAQQSPNSNLGGGLLGGIGKLFG
jgi:chromosome segregation ATPase